MVNACVNWEKAEFRRGREAMYSQLQAEEGSKVGESV